MGIIGKIARLHNKLDGIIENNTTPIPRTSFRAIRIKMILAKMLCGIRFSDFFFYQCERASYRQLFKMMYAKYFCGIDVSELLLYHCENASCSQIAQIVLFDEQDALWLRVNSAESQSILNDKYKTYLHFKDYYKRDMVFVGNMEAIDDYLSFCYSHPHFIVKPISKSCGRGIQLINANEASFSVDDYLNSNPNGFVVEELIKQDAALSQLHPESVNTVRINTVNYGKVIEVKWPCLRIGRGEFVVDNAGAGGIFGAIDVATGMITNVSDEHNHTFSEHPDTGVPLIGFNVPKWEEACEMAKHLAGMIPDCHFVGWDLALTDKGWVMVEGNCRPYLIYQIATGKGIRKEFSEMKKRLLQK